MERKKKLTAKEKLFCDEYLIDRNGAQAAIRAGYSERSAKEIACENLTKPHIQEYIKSRMQQIFLKLGISQERILEGFARIAFSDTRRLFNKNGTIKAIHQLDEDIVSALSGIEVEETIATDTTGKGRKKVTGATKKVKLADRLGALNALAKYYGIPTPQSIQINTPGGKAGGQDKDEPIRVHVTLNL